MNTEQQLAYDWAINQSYPSIAARHARSLAEVIDEIDAEMHRLHLCDACMHNCGRGAPHIKCGACIEGSAFEWAWSFGRRRKIENGN